MNSSMRLAVSGCRLAGVRIASSCAPSLTSVPQRARGFASKRFAPETQRNQTEDFVLERWRAASKVSETYFGDLSSHTAEYINTISERIKLGGRRVSFVDVGCGTGELVRGVADNFRNVVGVDVRPSFIEFCEEQSLPRHAAKTRFLQSDGCNLYDLMKAEFPRIPAPGSRGVEFWDDVRIVACAGNTIGTIPEEMRPRVYEQMAEVVGKDGILVMVYWNARWFGDACWNFYHAHPEQFGLFGDASVDFKTSTLTTSSQQHMHWSSVEEAESAMEKIGLEIISLREEGKGIFLAARRF